jgi:hypothetical protein
MTLKKYTPDERWAELELLQKHYAKFETFLYDVITELLGFTCTDIQLDIGQWIAYGPKYRMAQAQRGQAKTTITAAYIVWRIIHNPRARAIILSAGSELAQEVAHWVIQIIENMPELECLRPDVSLGDRNSVRAFDIHRDLKGAEKSPSISCMGITSNVQGKRADILVADDIESSKNSQTATQRQRLLHLTRDFTSICSTGDIIYLGTPQNSDSVYNSLPSRGFGVRIWPGRYPTKEELPNYQKFLAPLLQKRINDNPKLQTGGGPSYDRGQPTDPVLLSEDVLTAKEIDQGRAYFQLQHMLDTKLMDADRYPLKSERLVFMDIHPSRAPTQINWAAFEDQRIFPPQGFPLQEAYYKATGSGEEFAEYVGGVMYIDPAGGGKNGDEIGYAVTKFLAGLIFCPDIGGMPGGYEDRKLEELADIAVRNKVKIVKIEENFGKGAFAKIFQPVLFKKAKAAGLTIGIEEVWESGQKELRIIDTLEPIISAHRLIVDIKLLQKDWDMVQRYAAEHRSVFSLFFQIARITRDKGSLIHDDRLDALAGSCRHWVDALAQDAAKISAQIKNTNYQKLISNPLGNGRPLPGLRDYKAPNALSKFRRKS